MSRLWYDARLRAWLFQAVILAVLVGAVGWLVGNTIDNLALRGMKTGFDFLSDPARFPIAEALIGYAPTDTYLRAFLVGLVNTIYISCVTIAASSVFGALVGISRRSANPVVSGMAGAYVEAFRNTPLVVQLLFWYGMMTLSMPSPRAALEPLPGVFLSLRGLVLPWPLMNGTLQLAASVLGVGIVTALAASALRRRAGDAARRGWLSPAAVLLATALLAAAVAMIGGIDISRPALSGFNFEGGATLTPEFTALMVGLILYTSAFIAEIVRGAIDAVPRGQWEAGRAMGLREHQILRLVILPQALRIMVPPMTSQYLNVVKNTTLALAVGYPDFAAVVATTINQTSQAIEGVTILLLVYLTISVSISLFMTWYNARVALVQR